MDVMARVPWSRRGRKEAGVYVEIGQSNGVERSLVTCETVVSDDNPWF